MTHRLIVMTGDVITVRDYEDIPGSGHASDLAFDALCAARQPGVTFLAVRELPSFEEVSWSEVMDGDEVIAPDRSSWSVQDSMSAGPNLCGFSIVNVHDGREVTTTRRLDDRVRRRPGPVTVFGQMLADAGLPTRVIR